MSTRTSIDHPDGTRSCGRCGKRQPLEKFASYPKRGKRHHQARCNRCLYETSKGAYNDRCNSAVRDYKLEHGCADCGYKEHHAALQFDHVRGVKLFTIGEKILQLPMAQVWAEVAKCDVVCANCHFIRTFNRLKGED